MNEYIPYFDDPVHCYRCRRNTRLVEKRDRADPLRYESSYVYDTCGECGSSEVVRVPYSFCMDPDTCGGSTCCKRPLSCAE